MRRLAAATIGGLFLTLSSSGFGATADDSARNRLIAASEGAKRVDHAERKVNKYPLIVHPVVQAGGLRGNLAATRTLDGRLQATLYKLSGDASPARIASGYRERLQSAGYELLFDCSAKDCGPHFDQIAPGQRRAPGRFGAGQPGYYLAAHRRESGADIYTAVQVAPTSTGALSILVDRIRIEPLKVSAVNVSAQQMAQKIRKQGRVALYGIYFATDSARLKPASKPTLGQIAKLLRERPKLELIVVGHTDNTGTFDYNIALSRRRARAVVQTLADDYDIAADRLKPWGVGYTAPRATNRTGVGRAANRRVELVPR